jgi:predicted nucleotidyltransferase
VLEIKLTTAQRAALHGAIAPFAGAFDRVCVFGSRADGTSRPGSDVDLAVFGADERTASLLREAIEESDLSIFADVVRFESITDPRFAAVVAEQARTLFKAADFKARLA